MCCLTSLPNCRSASCRSSSVCGVGEPDVVVERELRIDGDDPVGAHDRVHPLTRVERVLHLVGRRRQPVAEQVLEQKLAEAAARLGRPKSLLQPREILRPVEHLRRRLVHLAEALVDLVRGLGRVLQPAVDLGVELAEPAVHGLGDPHEPPIDLGVPLRQLRAPVRPQVTQRPRQPGQSGGQPDAEQKDEDHVCHEPTDDRGGIGRNEFGAVAGPQKTPKPANPRVHRPWLDEHRRLEPGRSQETSARKKRARCELPSPAVPGWVPLPAPWPRKCAHHRLPGGSRRPSGAKLAGPPGTSTLAVDLCRGRGPRRGSDCGGGPRLRPHAGQRRRRDTKPLRRTTTRCPESGRRRRPGRRNTSTSPTASSRSA